MLILWQTVERGADGAAAHAAGRQLLARGLELLGLSGRERSVRRGANGKPFIPGGPEFSVSHTQGLAVCALDGGCLGVDAERVARIPEGLMAALTPEERAYVLSAESGREGRFYRIWTVKESLVKASGEGLGAIRELESAVTGDLKLKSRVGGFTVRALLLPAPGYAVAVSSESSERPVLIEGVQLPHPASGQGGLQGLQRGALAVLDEDPPGAAPRRRVPDR